MGAYQGAAWRHAEGALPHRIGGREGKGRRPRLPQLEPDRAAAVRSRAAAERRLLAARRISQPGRLRERCWRTCACRSGIVWPIPINLDVSREFAAGLKEGDHIALRDPEGVLIATMEVGDRWEPDKTAEARSVFGTDDDHHPGVHHLRIAPGPYTSEDGCAASSRRCITTSSCCATRRRSCADGSASSAGARSSRSRPETRCTARTRNSPSVRRASARPICSCIRWSA